MNIIMGIDQSYTATGYVVSCEHNILCIGLLTSDKKSDIFSRARYIANELTTIAKEHNVDIVALEGLAFGARGDATRNLAGLQFTIVNNIQSVLNIECRIYAPGTIKKVATGSGKATKLDLIAALPPHVRKMFDDIGVKKTTGLGDMSDAYWIGQTAEIYFNQQE